MYTIAMLENKNIPILCPYIYFNFLFFFSIQERTATLSVLAEKAKLTEQVLNTVPGIRCNPVQGAMYSFPCITIPEKAIKEAMVILFNALHYNNLYFPFKVITLVYCDKNKRLALHKGFYATL